MRLYTLKLVFTHTHRKTFCLNELSTCVEKSLLHARRKAVICINHLAYLTHYSVANHVLPYVAERNLRVH